MGHWDDAGFDSGNVDGRGHLAQDAAAGMLLMCCPSVGIWDRSVRGLGRDGCVIGGVGSDGFVQRFTEFFTERFTGWFGGEIRGGEGRGGVGI